MSAYIVSILFSTAAEIEGLSSRLRHEGIVLGLVTLLARMRQGPRTKLHATYLDLHDLICSFLKHCNAGLVETLQPRLAGPICYRH